MKIALVSEHASPLAALGGQDSGGQNVYVAALGRHLAARGHDVVVFTRRDSVSLPPRVAIDGYVVEHVYAGPPAPVSKDALLPHIPEFTDRLFERLCRGDFDIVHAHFWMSGLAARAASRPLDLPMVQTFHALGTVKRRHQGARDTSPASRIALERQLCHDVDHVIATCTDEVEELLSMGVAPQAVSVIPCGVDVERFRPSGRPDPTPTLLSIGRLVERKGVGNVIEALADVPGTRLIVAGGAGDTPDEPEIRRLAGLARQRHVGDRVVFVGPVPQSEVPRLMSRSVAVVSAPWYEPFGIVPVEAMACGRPVVGTAVGGLLDTVDEGITGTLVEPRRPDRLAAALRHVLEHPELGEAWGRAGRAKAVREYRWERVAASVEETYTKVRRGMPAAIPDAMAGARAAS